jgi:hypothetical protein
MPQAFDFDGIDPRNIVLHFARLQFARHFDAVRAIRSPGDPNSLALDSANAPPAEESPLLGAPDLQALVFTRLIRQRTGLPTPEQPS